MSEEFTDGFPTFVGDAEFAFGINVAGQDTGQHVAGGSAGEFDLGFIFAPEFFIFSQIRPIFRGVFGIDLVGVISQQDRLFDDGVVVAVRVIQTGADFIGPGRGVEGHDDSAGDEVVPDDGVQTEHNVTRGGGTFVDQTLLYGTGAFFNDGQGIAIGSGAFFQPVGTAGGTVIVNKRAIPFFV